MNSVITLTYTWKTSSTSIIFLPVFLLLSTVAVQTGLWIPTVIQIVVIFLFFLVWESQWSVTVTNTETFMQRTQELQWQAAWLADDACELWKGSEQSTLWSMWLKWFLWAVNTSWWSLLHNLLVLHLCGRLQYPSTQIHLILSLLTLLKF